MGQRVRQPEGAREEGALLALHAVVAAIAKDEGTVRELTAHRIEERVDPFRFTGAGAGGGDPLLGGWGGGAAAPPESVFAGGGMGLAGGPPPTPVFLWP